MSTAELTHPSTLPPEAERFMNDEPEQKPPPELQCETAFQPAEQTSLLCTVSPFLDEEQERGLLGGGRSLRFPPTPGLRRALSFWGLRACLNPFFRNRPSESDPSDCDGTISILSHSPSSVSLLPPPPESQINTFFLFFFFFHLRPSLPNDPLQVIRIAQELGRLEAHPAKRVN